MVAAYQALRGVCFLGLVAITFVAKVGDVHRFATPQQLMAFLGLVPSERTTRRGSITKTGNHRARGVLIEGAWTYRFPAGSARPCEVGSRIFPRHPQHRLEGTGPAVRPLPSAHCQWQEDPHCDNSDYPRAGCLPVGNRSAGCTPEAGHIREPSSCQTDCCLARAFAVNPSRQEARPWRAVGIDRSARPRRNMLPCDECGTSGLIYVATWRSARQSDTELL
jgi:hypothetical protein